MEVHVGYNFTHRTPVCEARVTVGLIAQLVEHCTDIGFESRLSLNFFQA